MKKTIMMLFAATALVCASFGASAQNKFVNDQLDNNAAANGAKIVNVAKIQKVKLSGSAVTITKADLTTEAWAGGWTIFDRFVSGSRSSGADFNYFQEPSTGDHYKISYSAIASVVCTSAPYGGTTMYTATIKFTPEAGGGTLVASVVFSSICQNFN